jgi:signal transduction histidine kinase
MKIILYLYFLFLSFSLYGKEDTRIAEIEAKIAAATHDTTLSNLYNDLYWFYALDNPEKALEIAKKGLLVTQRTYFPRGQASFLMKLGQYYSDIGQYVLATDYYDQAHFLYDSLQDKQGIARVVLAQADVYLELGNDVIAEKYLRSSLEAILNSPTQSEGEILEKALCLRKLGVVQEMRGNHREAIRFYTTSRKVSESVGYNLITVNTICFIANNYCLQKNYKTSLQYLADVYDTLAKQPNKNGVSKADITYANIYIAYNKLDKALKHALNAFNYADCHKSKNKKIYSESALLLSKIYLLKKDYKQALKYQLLYNDFDDKNYNKAMMLEVIQRNHERQLSKNKAQMELLKQQNEFHQATIKNQQYTTIYLTLILLLAVTAVVVSILFIRSKMKITKEIEEKNTQILRQNEEIKLINFTLSERNEELERQNELIENQSEEIATINNSLIIQNENLQRINKKKHEIISVVSHDLRAPLVRIIGLIDLLHFDLDMFNDEHKEYITKIKIEAYEQLSMIEYLLRGAEEDKKEDIQQLEVVDIEKLVTKLVNDSQIVATRKNIQIELSINANGVSLLHITDERAMLRIIDNLLSNAIKFSPFNSKIEVSITTLNTHLTIAIKDEGVGILPEEMGKLFQKYEKLSAVPTADEPSTGLGLYIVKELVEQLGGKVWCESEYQKGATFFVSFPKESPKKEQQLV